MRVIFPSVLVGVCCGLASIEAGQQSKTVSVVAGRVLQSGLSIDFEVKPYDPKAPKARGAREGDDVTIDFVIRDAASGNPLPGLNPAAWLTASPRSTEAASATCTDRLKMALGQSLLARAERDLNTYYVIALNADATITVVDPLFGYGGTKLLALIPLETPGEDWVLTSDHNRLFVSMPRANKVAVVDTRSWSITARIEIGAPAARLALQPDEAYLWVDYGTAVGVDSGVAVVNRQSLKVVAHIATGRGRHQMVFSDDSRFAFVTNPDDGTLSVVDVRSLRKIKDVALGSRPSAVTFSKMAEAVYVTSHDAGTITAIGSRTHDVLARISATPGLGPLRFAAGDRLGFAVNGQTDTVSIVDAATNTIVLTADTEKGPDDVAFSRRFAYVRHRRSEIVVMIPVDEVAKDAKSVPVLDFPGGQHPFGEASRSSLAASIVPAADDNAVLVANPRDRAIYYYQEGMAAPMGNFSNYGREPLAVLVVDRGLRETTPGVYRTAARLPKAGRYEAVLFINSPRVVHCFEVPILPNMDLTSISDAPTARIESLTRETSVRPGESMSITLRLSDPRSGRPLVDVADAHVLIMAAGVWQTRQPVEHVGMGVYTLTVVPPASGLYNVYLTSPSRRLEYTQVFTFEASGAK